MNKHTFTYQHYYLKVLCAFPLLIIALFIQYHLEEYIHNDMLFYICCALIMGTLLTLYYLGMSKYHLFESTGYYYEDDHKITMELGNHTYEIEKVEELMGGEPNIFLYQYAYLFIKTNHQKIKIFGQGLSGDDTFNDSDLYLLFLKVLNKNTDLVPKTMFDQKMDNWYVKR